jgi:zinc transport system substrate-binding protein
MVFMRMRHGTVWASGLIAMTLAVAGCTQAASSTSTVGTKITVTVAAYPLEFLTERIIGDTGTVTDLTAPGTEPHDLELTARQIADMSSTDAVVYLSGFQAAVDEAIASTPPKRAIDATTGLDRLPALASEEGSATATYDPHVWLSPANMVAMAATISTSLSTAKPELASTFAANTTKLVADLNSLDTSYKTGLAQCAITQFVTSHAAFAYLAKRYGLEQIPISGLDPTEEPTAARIAAVQKLAKQYHVTTIFFETLISDAVAKSIAGDLGLKSAVLDPIEGITKVSAGTNYLEVMQSNLSALQEANGCR